MRQPNGEVVLTTPFGKYVWDGTLELLEYHVKDKPTPDDDWVMPGGRNDRMTACLMACSEEAKRLKRIGVRLTGKKEGDGAATD